MPPPSWRRHREVGCRTALNKAWLLRSSAPKVACGARPRAYPADCSVDLWRIKHALPAGRSATRFAGSAMLEMLGDILLP